LKTLSHIFLLFSFYIMVSACGEKMPLPSVQPNLNSFGANDTSYIKIIPDWDASSIGYQQEKPMAPVDIAIGQDEYIYVADSANNTIFVLYKSGEIVRKFNLDKIGMVEKPSSLAIDEKLNLLIVNGTNKVYVWNQFFNYAGVDLSGDQADADSLLGICTFYTDPDPTSQFHGIAFGPESDNSVFLTDKQNNRIVKLNLVMWLGVRLDRGFAYPAFKGVFEMNIAEYGSGAGTVDDPRGITVDDDGNIYFTQLGGNFLVQKLVANGASYFSGYTLYEDPIMDLKRFVGPFDISLGLENAIFIIDRRDDGKVIKFHNRGDLAGRLADLGNEGLISARFGNSAGIAISSDETVYIANTSSHKIERYQYTVSEDDLPDEEY